MPLRTCLALFASQLLLACGFLPPTESTLPTDPAQAQRQSDTLVIMLPGRGGRGSGFREQGFFETGATGDFDMLAADAHLGYYRERTVIRRLHEDVILPARKRGYKKIWLLGTSMGALGSVLYSREHPEQVDGLIMIAPYLGDEALIEEITEAGGLDNWPNEGTAGEDYQRGVWQWLKAATAEPGKPPILLAYGTEDRFAPASELLGPRLPDERVFTLPGKHRWTVWKPLWRQVVSSGLPDSP